MISHRKPLKRRKPLARGHGPKRGGSLRRGVGLKRKSWPKRKYPKRKYQAKDPGFVAWLHWQPCAARRLSPCEWGIEAHHAGKNPGYAMKADDSTCMPLCTYHHQALGSFSGPFRTWTGERARRWQDEQIAEHRSRYLASEGKL